MKEPSQRPPNKPLVRILLFLVCFCGSYFLIPTAHYYRGKLEAYRDISNGTYKGWRCAYHFDPTPTRHFDDLMLKYANFQIETTNDCDFRKLGYTDVQKARLNRLYPGIEERTLNETIQWERQRLKSMGLLVER